MAYKIDPKALAARRKAAGWHALLNNGFHFALCHPTTGAVIEKVRYQWQLTTAHRLRPFLQLVNVDDQI